MRLAFNGNAYWNKDIRFAPVADGSPPTPAGNTKNDSPSLPRPSLSGGERWCAGVGAPTSKPRPRLLRGRRQNWPRCSIFNTVCGMSVFSWPHYKLRCSPVGCFFFQWRGVGDRTLASHPEHWGLLQTPVAGAGGELRGGLGRGRGWPRGSPPHPGCLSSTSSVTAGLLRLLQPEGCWGAGFPGTCLRPAWIAEGMIPLGLSGTFQNPDRWERGSTAGFNRRKVSGLSVRGVSPRIPPSLAGGGSPGGTWNSPERSNCPLRFFVLDI